MPCYVKSLIHSPLDRFLGFYDYVTGVISMVIKGAKKDLGSGKFDFLDKSHWPLSFHELQAGAENQVRTYQ